MLQAHGIIPQDRPSGVDHTQGSLTYAGERARYPNYHARPQVKVEPRTLEERLGSEYYDDMRVEVRSCVDFSWLPDRSSRRTCSVRRVSRCSHITTCTLIRATSRLCLSLR